MLIFIVFFSQHQSPLFGAYLLSRVLKISPSSFWLITLGGHCISHFQEAERGMVNLLLRAQNCRKHQFAMVRFLVEKAIIF